MTRVGARGAALLLLLAAGCSVSENRDFHSDVGPTPAVALGPTVVMAPECKQSRHLIDCSQLNSVGTSTFEVVCGETVGDKVYLDVVQSRPRYTTTLICDGVDSGVRRTIASFTQGAWERTRRNADTDVYVGKPGTRAEGHQATLRFGGTVSRVRVQVSVLGPAVTS